MPRLPTSAILRAYQKDPLLPLLLQECRTYDSAQNELRWLREWAVQKFAQRKPRLGATTHGKTQGWRSHLRAVCRKRARGVPLQYILGDQPFGDLEIICRKGVLIPRYETESYVVRAADWILDNMRHNPQLVPGSKGEPGSLRILDLCTGTGCIPLLLHALLAPHFKTLDILGVDLSPTAVRLAMTNLKHNMASGALQSRAITDVRFRQGDVLGRRDTDIPSVEDVLGCGSIESLHNSDHAFEDGHKWDVLISNPPYVSPVAFRDGTTSRSVRTYEPKLALVPPTTSSCHVKQGTDILPQEDTFYPSLLRLSSKLRVRLTVLECGDPQQAQRLLQLAESFGRIIQMVLELSS
ncbi:S-adenosylmethionine-dependent methyltransferase [Paecilomyces variotii No. 5]|uniref:S-adenosylmethionine-dependent methyltransferase n=1 Tax=Byssochlamys spectabilis (strain No. 5 / NBRC 109023) TaxID=1356009 RepID=V5G4G7_BYSSN|nr:S-adenosylmethionine-dependent methyltransferase [Paecilomyces variotii No. 5]